MNIEITLKELNGKQIPAVTSQQVAEAFGKEHKNVMRDIREIMDKCSESFNALNFELVTYKDAKGEERPMYLLTKDGLMMVTMGYTTPEAMRVKEAYIARFNEMEEQLRSASPAIPDFQNPALAARAWAEQYERRQIAEAQRDEAIRTKAEIGSRREATSMATASAAIRQRDALADKLGEGKHYKQVKAIPWLLEVFHESAGMYTRRWVASSRSLVKGWASPRASRKTASTAPSKSTMWKSSRRSGWLSSRTTTCWGNIVSSSSASISPRRTAGIDRNVKPPHIDQCGRSVDTRGLFLYPSSWGNGR